MPGLYKTDAIVLRSQEYLEADRLLTLFTKKAGKVAAIAKGVRRPKSRMAGHLLPFAHLRLVLIEGRGLHTVTSVETIAAYRGLREDLLRMAMASVIVELTDVFIQEGQADEPLFQLLKNTLAFLEKESDPRIFYLAYQLRLLTLVGFAPSLEACVVCGRPVASVKAIHLGLVGVLCSEHQLTGKSVSAALLPVLYRMQQSDLNSLRILRLTQALGLELREILEAWLRSRLDHPLRSLAFLQEMWIDISATP